MIAKRISAPEPPLEPPRRVGQREVRQRLACKPVVVQAVRRVYERAVKEIAGVVKDDPGADGGDVSHERKQDEAGSLDQRRFVPGAGACI